MYVYNYWCLKSVKKIHDVQGSTFLLENEENENEKQ